MEIIQKLCKLMKLYETCNKTYTTWLETWNTDRGFSLLADVLLLQAEMTNLQLKG